MVIFSPPTSCVSQVPISPPTLTSCRRTAHLAEEALGNSQRFRLCKRAGSLFSAEGVPPGEEETSSPLSGEKRKLMELPSSHEAISTVWPRSPSAASPPPCPRSWQARKCILWIPEILLVVLAVLVVVVVGKPVAGILAPSPILLMQSTCCWAGKGQSGGAKRGVVLDKSVRNVPHPAFAMVSRRASHRRRLLCLQDIFARLLSVCE
jgi:hypothetical protein